MKSQIFPALKLTFACVVVFAVLYPLSVWAIAQFAPNGGKGETINHKGQPVGYVLVGQLFTDDKYFNSRPSAVGYNAAGSAGSNKGASNPDYLKDVQTRIDSFSAHNPSVAKAQIPSELVTASGSGLDPNLSPEGAAVQVSRVAKTRGISEAKVKDLVETNTQLPALGMPIINVLALNIALDDLK